MKKIFRAFAYMTSFGLFMNQALAAEHATEDIVPSTGGESLPNPLGVTSFEVLADKILGYMLVIAVPIATLMILVGAYQILFAAGDPEKVKTGKQTILYTVIAFAIILIGKGITLIIKDVLGVK